MGGGGRLNRTAGGPPLPRLKEDEKWVTVYGKEISKMFALTHSLFAGLHFWARLTRSGGWSYVPFLRSRVVEVPALLVLENA